MIQSILDNDLYKFTMQQAVHILYPRVQAEYTLIGTSNVHLAQKFNIPLAPWPMNGSCSTGLLQDIKRPTI
jgi:hypothetical protein